MIEYLDNEERDFFESLYDKELVISPNKKEIDKYVNYAQNNVEVLRKFEIEISERDLLKFKAKAFEQGINYKSLVSILIHQYNKGRIAVNV